MENPKRGEMTIALGEKTYQARVTMDVVMRIERSLGKGIIKIASSLSEADISTEQIVNIITPVVRAGGNDIKDVDIKKDLWDAGLAEGIRVCSEIIALVLNAGEDVGNVEEAGQLNL